jgi:serine/threonine protein kinase
MVETAKNREEFKYINGVGNGAQARVEIWQHIATGGYFGVKIYQDPTPGQSDQIFNEANISKQIKSLALVKCFCCFLPTESDPTAWIVLENMAGGTLAKAITDKSILKNPTLMNQTIISLVKGLLALHRSDVLHRDLKPGNVLFTEDGFAKIGDFGSARTIQSDVSQTRGGKSLVLVLEPGVERGGSGGAEQSE